MIERKEAHVFVPRGALRLAELRLDDQQRGISFPRKYREVLTLHGPVVGVVEKVVGRANDKGIEVVALHHQARALPLFLIDRISHALTAYSPALRSLP